jgi:hypothetical protein
MERRNIGSPRPLAAPTGAALRWRSQFAPEPACRFEGFDRIDKLDHALMNRPALRALERADVNIRGTGGNAGQHGSCLARGAKWPQDEHDASPWIRRESYSSQSPVDAVMGGDQTSMEPPLS